MRKYKLENERLKIHITIPDDTYRKSRFDRIGMIEEVILDDQHTFCGIESKIPGDGSGGKGFYNEFGIEHPIGYDEIKTGEQFLKIGVGYLFKYSQEPYDFFHDYQVKELKIDAEAVGSSMTVHTETQILNGYGVDYEKKISIHENKMILEYTLKNIGTKAINTTEYCHNFLSINNHPIGPDYTLNFSFPLEIDESLGDINVKGNTLAWDRDVSSVLYTTFKNLPKGDNNYFEILHSSGLGVRETVNFELFKVAVWGMPHVISPEAFIKIDLNPSDTMTWRREYTFFKS